jgi:hypothetical protein
MHVCMYEYTYLQHIIHVTSVHTVPLSTYINGMTVGYNCVHVTILYLYDILKNLVEHECIVSTRWEPPH